MSGSDGNNKIVDIDELKEIMDDDMELIRECFADFVKDWPMLYVQIKGAVLEKNSKVLEETSHKIKGTLRYLAAEDAAQAAYALESAGKDNDMNDIDRKLAALKDECQKVVGYIQNFTA